MVVGSWVGCKSSPLIWGYDPAASRPRENFCATDSTVVGNAEVARRDSLFSLQRVGSRSVGARGASEQYSSL